MSRPSAPTSSDAIRLREYRARDFDALCELDRVCFPLAIAYSRHDMQAYLSAPGADCVVAENNGGVVGFCITVRAKQQAYIVTIDVAEGLRKQGIGGALIVEAEKRLASRGIRVVALDTATDNVSAIAFWQTHGYRKIGIRKGYYPDGRDAFAMTKPIAR